MDNDLRRVNAKANAGMATGITALGVEAAGIIAGVIDKLATGQNHNSGNDAVAAMSAVLPAVTAMAVASGSSGSGCTCNEDHVVNRYEAAQQARIAELETEVKLRDANTYTDQKMLEMYKYIDGQLKAVNGEICRQAVLNQQTADSFKLVEKDIQRERDERCCADNSIVTYVNASFYPKMIADVTTGTATTAQSLYNPLPNCGCCK